MPDIQTIWNNATGYGDWAMGAPAQLQGGAISDTSGNLIGDTGGGEVGDFAGITLGFPDLVSGGDLVTAVLLSWFTDATAASSDVIPDGSGDPRGWWGDAYTAGSETYPIGSRLWLLGREKQRDVVLAKAQQYAAEAVQWIIDDGVCSRIDVSSEFFAPGSLGVVGDFYPPVGQPLTLRYAVLWSGVD